MGVVSASNTIASSTDPNDEYHLSTELHQTKAKMPVPNDDILSVAMQTLKGLPCSSATKH